MTPKKFNAFLMFKLPIAYIAGVRVVKLNDEISQTRVKFSKLNQNPFKSMFWAVQGMAAELSTGVVFMSQIQASKQKISMLVVKQEASFQKKAIGRITFTCDAVKEIKSSVSQAANSNDPILIPIKSTGKDETGDIVSVFTFYWSLKRKSK